ncbi:MAG: hypothetical protein H6712_34010 [Myxococcales bacterium]|nr:hypothetical protein [Myxococcales bacterium]MCB9718909.1 hypothetical protein [Myxococcales bacterium]
MKREFRRPAPDDQPTAGGLDELLESIPEGGSYGPLTGYRDGSRVRRWVYLALVLGVVAAVLAGRWYVGYLEEQRRIPTPEYQLAEGAEDEERPDVLVWTSGIARLGLTRQQPGIRAIVLPDRIITLAPSCDHAQIKVDVRDGETTMLKVVVGEIRQRPREAGDGG